MKKGEKGVCLFCGAEFIAKNNNQKYCSLECQKKENNRRHCERFKKRSAEARAKAKETKKKTSIADVIRFCNAYEERTGRYLPYGKAVVMMESGI